MQTKNCSVVISDESIEFKDVPVNKLFVSIVGNLMFKVSDTEAVRLRDSQVMNFGAQKVTLIPESYSNRMSEPVKLAAYRE